MALERNRFGFNGEISFECDECGTEHHSDTSSFHEALDSMKEEGWMNIKGRHDWEHYCGDDCLTKAKRSTEKR